jgi:peptidoglycan/xylan/chitin deacetylase (PgdA/CDA1 family)
VELTFKRVARGLLRPAQQHLDRSLGSVVSVRTDEPCFVMTYDDGPEPGSTEAVLGALAAHGATATFFVLVNRARAERSLLHEVAAAGHEIALHGIDHRPLTGFSPADVRRRTAAGKHELEDLLGSEVRWFRPPYGKQSLRTWRAVRSTGLEPVLWGPVLQDWLDVPQQERVDSALTNAAAGAVILGHDGFAGPTDGVDDGPRPELDRGDLTRRVLDGYAAKGLTARALGDALREGTPGRRVWLRR